MDSPFLTQFRRKRIDDVFSGSIKLRYDPKLEYNIFESKDNSKLITLVMTKTQVKTEQPDEDSSELNAEQIRNLYLQTKSYTEVKIEKADEIDETFCQELIATQTFTRSISEQSDQDY